MEEQTEETEKTVQQMIREMGELVHADGELNQDGLPVYFRVSLPGGFRLVVDLERKDEIGIDCPNKGYKVINQIVADLVFQIALAYIEIEETQNRGCPSLAPSDPYPLMRDNGAPYEITCTPHPHVLLPDDIPEGTTIAGKNNEN